MRVWLRIRCAFAGHPRNICVLEKINGQLWAVEETCECGKRHAAMFPGAHVKVFHDAYKDYPTEWQDIF